MKNLLIVFVKEPKIGEVKTRLAKEVGNLVAVEIYKNLLTYTRQVIDNLNIKVWIGYGNQIPEKDVFWQDAKYSRFQQVGVDLGERMYRSFEVGFGENYEKIVLIGSDCGELTPEIIENAFELLTKKDCVIGPAVDGGYYLIGLSQLIKPIFEHKKWSTETVFQETLEDLKDYSLDLLPTLQDIDNKSDILNCRNINLREKLLKLMV